MALTILHGALSDVGRKRPHNEDRYCVDSELGLFVVCDGMGGGNAGEVASALAVDTIHRHCLEAAADPALPIIGEPDATVSATTNRLASAIRLANAVVHRSAMEHRERSGMGTTVVAALYDEPLLSFAHVGDSRLYLCRDRTIRPLTADHSWVAEQVRQGFLSEEEAERSPRRNIVTRALGAEATVDVSLGELPLFPGDVLLLCSDGLTKDVRPSRICGVLHEAENVEAAARRLIALANEAGGEDNTTVVVLAVREQHHAGLWERLRQRLITRRQNAYFVSKARTAKKLLVNGEELTGERELRDKDRIDVAGVALLFRAARDKTA
jgi:serine/threonine protein phosphatase PrpC